MSATAAIEIAKGRDNPLGLALLTMAQELWVLKDRQIVLEAMLRDKGMLDDIDTYQPTAALAEQLTEERQRFITAITTILLTGKPAE